MGDRAELIQGVKDALRPLRFDPNTFITDVAELIVDGQWLAEVKAEAWDEGMRAGWKDRTHSFIEARTYEQEVARATRNPYREAVADAESK